MRKWYVGNHYNFTSIGPFGLTAALRRHRNDGAECRRVAGRILGHHVSRPKCGKAGSLLGLVGQGIYQRDQGMKNRKDNENKEPSKGKVGRPPFVPTDEDRAVVKLLIACGMTQDRACSLPLRRPTNYICSASISATVVGHKCGARRSPHHGRK